jgi:hypothetical protein
MNHRTTIKHASSPSSADTFGHDVKTILTAMRLQTQLMQRIVRRERTPDRGRLLTGLAAIDASISRLVECEERERG